MESIISVLRDVIGEASFYVDGTLDYAALLEYFFAGVLLIVVVGSIFKVLVNLCSR